MRLFFFKLLRNVAHVEGRCLTVWYLCACLIRGSAHSRHILLPQDTIKLRHDKRGVYIHDKMHSQHLFAKNIAGRNIDEIRGKVRFCRLRKYGESRFIRRNEILPAKRPACGALLLSVRTNENTCHGKVTSKCWDTSEARWLLSQFYEINHRRKYDTARVHHYNKVSYQATVSRKSLSLRSLLLAVDVRYLVRV